MGGAQVGFLVRLNFISRYRFHRKIRMYDNAVPFDLISGIPCLSLRYVPNLDSNHNAPTPGRAR